MIRSPFRSTLTAAASLAAAVGAFATPAGAQQVTVEGGARVLSYDAAARPRARWTVEPTPVFQVGGAEGEGPTEFSQVLGVARLSDGRVVMADAASTELRVFSPAGAFQRIMGRKGQGPGEFDGIQSMLRSADTLVVHDRTSRLQFYTGDGRLLRSYARPAFAGRGTPSWPGVLGDGTGVVQGVDPVTDTVSERSTSTASLGLRAPNAADVRAFTRIPVFERVRRGKSSAGLFLGAVSRVAVMGSRVCAGYAIRWEIRCFDRTGTLLSRTIRDTRPGKVTEADKEEFRKGYLAANRSGPIDRVRAAIDRIEYAEQRSAFGRFVPSPTGELWVGEFVVLESFVPGRRGTVSPTRPTTWSVLAPDGSWTADVVLPARFSLLDAGRDYVAGVLLGEDDVESVVVYRLRR